MKSGSIISLAFLWAVFAQAAILPPGSLEILRPNSSDQLQPGTMFRFQWRLQGSFGEGNWGDWNLFLDTNNVQVGRLFATPVHDGNGNWHADVLLPEEVHPFTRWDETRVPLPSACNYTLRIHEDGTEADDRSDVFCLGVPVVGVRVSQVAVCWSSRSNRLYQVQFRSQLTTNAWISLGATVQGNGSTNCITDAIVPGQPQRYYRVEELP